MQKIKYNVPIPKWFVFTLIAALVIVALALLAFFNVAGIGDGLLIAAEYLAMGIFMWGASGWVQGITLWITLGIGFGIVFLLIAKRRYLKSHEAYVQTQGGYVARGSEISSAALPTTPQTPQVVEEPPKEEQK